MSARLVACAVVVVGVLGASAILVRAREPSGPNNASPDCAAEYFTREAQFAPTAPVTVIPVPTSPDPPGSIVEIAPWDHGVDWAFREEAHVFGAEPHPYLLISEGVFHAHVALDLTVTDLHPAGPGRNRLVVLGRTFWSERSSSGRRTGGCPLPENIEPRNPLGVQGPIARRVDPGHPPVVAQTQFIAGARVPVGPGTPTTVDGEPGTTYEWLGEAVPWLKVEFTLDGRSQLRAARATDRELGIEYLNLWARPDPNALIADPSNQPIVAPP